MAVWPTTVLAVAAITAATVAVCLKQIDATDWITIVGAFGGGAGVHAAAVSSRATSGGGVGGTG